MSDFQLCRGISGSCKHFGGCSAPMCPKDMGAAKTSWFADEPVCRLHDVPEWVKRQRRIAKTSATETAEFHTLPMLERRCVIGKKMAGICPDGTAAAREAAERNWLDRHPPIRSKSGAEREKLAARMRRLRGIPS